jgi:mRNA interferase YafQ
MLKPSYTKQFKKDLKKLEKNGKDKEEIKDIIKRLVNEEVLPDKNKDHKLTGNYRNRRECHIEPDWLLIYKIDGDDIIFERTGSHSELFK